MTTASLSIIDKAHSSGAWKFFDIGRGGEILEAPYLTDDGEPALAYEKRGEVWGMRGLSPGTQKVFTLTESERVACNLGSRDVRPCVTSLKHLPPTLKVLDHQNFNKYYVSKNKRCWLIRTDKRLSKSLRKYVVRVPSDKRETATCTLRESWYKYKAHPTPGLLISSAFKLSGPRILSNKVKATAVGTVFGIHSHKGKSLDEIHRNLLRFDFHSRIVAREMGLKKIAIKQLNAALNLLVNKSHDA